VGKKGRGRGTRGPVSKGGAVTSILNGGESVATKAGVAKLEPLRRAAILKRRKGKREQRREGPKEWRVATRIKLPTGGDQPPIARDEHQRSATPRPRMIARLRRVKGEQPGRLAGNPLVVEDVR